MFLICQNPHRFDRGFWLLSQHSVQFGYGDGNFLDMIQWEILDQTINIVPAVPCIINRGIMHEAKNPVDLPAHVFVDDAIMLSSNAKHMKMLLAAMIESIFTVMGEPEEDICQCPLAMDKWRELIVGLRQIVLGLIIDTNWLTAFIPIKYRVEVLNLLDSLGTHIGIISFNDLKPRNSPASWHALPKVPTGYFTFYPTYSLLLHMHYPRTSGSWPRLGKNFAI
jgi:hypothetical protein